VGYLPLNASADWGASVNGEDEHGSGLPFFVGDAPFVLNEHQFIDDDSDEKQKIFWRQDIARRRKLANQEFRRARDERQKELERLDREDEEYEKERRKYEGERRDEENPPPPPPPLPTPLLG